MSSSLKRLSWVLGIMAILGGGWFLYTQWILPSAQANVGSWPAQENKALILKIIISAVIFGLIALAVWFWKFISKISRRRDISRLAEDIRRSYLEPDFFNMIRQFGIIYNEKAIQIKRKVLRDCRLAELARLVVIFLIAGWERFRVYLEEDSNIFQSLADLLIASWDKESVDLFVSVAIKENAMIGWYIKRSVGRQRVYKEVADFQRQIRARLEAIETESEQETAVHQEKLAGLLERCAESFSGGFFSRWRRIPS